MIVGTKYAARKAQKAQGLAKKPLTAQQERILNFVEDYTRQHGIGPTIREICAEYGYNSTSTPHNHLKTLQRKGYLTHKPWANRNYAVALRAGQRRVTLIATEEQIQAIQGLIEANGLRDVKILVSEGAGDNQKSQPLRSDTGLDGLEAKTDESMTELRSCIKRQPCGRWNFQYVDENGVFRQAISGFMNPIEAAEAMEETLLERPVTYQQIAAALVYYGYAFKAAFGSAESWRHPVHGPILVPVIADSEDYDLMRIEMLDKLSKALRLSRWEIYEQMVTERK